MPISVQCDQCGKTLKVPDTAAGKRGKCPCGAVLVIPAAGGIQTAPSAPARAAAAAPRKSQARPASVAAGDWPAPATFKKLFNGIVLCWLLTIATVLVMVIMSFVAVGAVASDAKKIQVEQDRYFAELKKWQDGGGAGPAPNPPTFETSGGTAAAGIGSFIASMAGFCFIGVFGIAMAVFGYVFIYKAWALIQDGNPRTTPGKAIGMMFVPLYNIYWNFMVTWGLAQDLNTYARDHDIDARPASETMMLWGLILTILGCTAPIGAIMLFLGWNSIKNTCMDIAAAKAAA